MSPIEQILITKLYIPQPRVELVPRPRLIERLDDGMQGKLTLVSAPAGYGKTTLVSAWVHQSERSVAWLSLDENDNDLTRFLTYLISCLQQIDGDMASEVLTTLESSQSPQVEILLTMLVNEIAASGNQFILVLDDCHLITNQDIYEALEFLINHQPPEMHLVIIGRVDPPISLSRLRVGGELTKIRSEHLRFTKMEATAFLNDLMNLELSLDDIIALGVRTEGWVAGLQLAALFLQGREDKHEFIAEFSGIHHHLIDYLVDEVLSRQPDEIRLFLCRTSILERFNESLCNATLEISNSQQILEVIDETNLFLVPMDEERRWFRYHHLFSDFLVLCAGNGLPLVLLSAKLTSERILNEIGIPQLQRGFEFMSI